MDVCTFIFATTVTLQACYTPQVCKPNEDKTKILCVGGSLTTCSQKLSWWECKTPEGKIYIKDANELK